MLICIARRWLPLLLRLRLGTDAEHLRVRALLRAAAPNPFFRRGAVTRSSLMLLLWANVTT